MHKYFLIIVLFLAGMTNASSQDIQNSKENEINGIIRLMNYDEIFSINKKSCIETLTNGWSSPNGFSSRKERFYDKTKDSPDWSQILNLHKEYVYKVCSHPEPQEYKNLLIKVYTQKLGYQSLSDLKEFLSSSSGREFVDGNNTFTSEMVALMSQESETYSFQAYRKFTEEMQKIDNSTLVDNGRTYLVIFSVLILLFGVSLGFWLGSRQKHTQK